MLNEELENIARLKHLTLVNAEKDFLQELILFSLYSQVSDELVFKGGTCLYKIYKLDRFSEDLDFTLAKMIDIEKISSRIIADIALIGIKGRIKEIKKYKNEINVRMLFNGPLFRGSKETQCFIPLNISLKEKIIFEPKKENFVSLYKEIRNFDIFAMCEEEILAEKIRTILTRNKPRDVYDLWFLLIKKNISFNLKLVNAKLKLYNLKFNLNSFSKELSIKRGLWNIDLKNLILGNLPDFDKIKKEIMLKIKKNLL